jgi:hypothetical protein
MRPVPPITTAFMINMFCGLRPVKEIMYVLISDDKVDSGPGRVY